ncbi:hypothetical protein K1719_010031 [Acacia pycnantha]|nr:hypothetical protein K1719_010031 [Acacia pycnantha]
MEEGAAGSMHKIKDVSVAVTLQLAFQSLGIVYGDIGTSPLYVLSSTFSDGIKDVEDILGVLSLIFYTITLLPLVKYVWIVLQANDNGQGGTFAMYSLMCRYAKVSLIPNRQEEDAKVSNYHIQRADRRTKRASGIKSSLEKSQCAKFILLIAAMLGTSMVIGDGVLTPCISVLSAVDGLKRATPSITDDVVAWISVAILLLLFVVQRYGTGKVGYSFAPILFLWFICIGSIGLYNFIKYEPSVIKALNPYYIVKYFHKNKTQAWISLGGVVLCITGAEAMFADVGHFSVKAIQISMCSVVYPSLMIAYAGQASYLHKHPENVADTFYTSIPAPLYWPMFVIAILAAIIASQALISGTFSIIQQALSMGCFPRMKIVHTSAKHEGQVYIPEINYILMILCVIVTLVFKSTTTIGNAYGIAVVSVMTLTSAMLVIIMLMVWKTNMFFIVCYIVIIGLGELIYLSSVLYKFGQGGYLPLAFALVVMAIMYVWNYVYRQKYYYEMNQKISPERVKDMVVSNQETNKLCRIPGLAMFYSELVEGIPPIFKHYVTNVPALHSVLVFMCVKSLPISKVAAEERFLFSRVEPKEANIFRCIARYGYTDIRNEKEPFEKVLAEKLKDFIAEEAIGEETEDVTREVEKVEEAVKAGIVHLVGDTDVTASKGSTLGKRIVIDYAYSFLIKNLRETAKVFDIPHERMVKVGMIYHL